MIIEFFGKALLLDKKRFQNFYTIMAPSKDIATPAKEQLQIDSKRWPICHNSECIFISFYWKFIRNRML